MYNLELQEQRKNCRIWNLLITPRTPYRLRWNLKHCLCSVGNRRRKNDSVIYLTYFVADDRFVLGCGRCLPDSVMGGRTGGFFQLFADFKDSHFIICFSLRIYNSTLFTLTAH